MSSSDTPAWWEEVSFVVHQIKAKAFSRYIALHNFSLSLLMPRVGGKENIKRKKENTNTSQTPTTILDRYNLKRLDNTMAWIPLFVLPIMGWAAVAGTFGAIFGSEKRGIEASHAIFHINATELRGKDVQRLQGLHIDLVAADKALFSNGEFSVEGNVTVRIPGLAST